jgi:DNA polymerase-3 subunit epsilon
MLLFFDTETTGFNNPHLVQLGALLTDDNGHEMCSLDVIVKNYGRSVEPGALAVHGISEEHRANFGVGLPAAIHLFTNLLEHSRALVAHNYSFDERVMNAALFEVGVPSLNSSLSFCTMKAATPIVRIPNTNRGGFKWPKLFEAYRFFFNEPLSGAHNAMVDCRACARVYFALQNLCQTPPSSTPSNPSTPLPVSTSTSTPQPSTISSAESSLVNAVPPRL